MAKIDQALIAAHPDMVRQIYTRIGPPDKNGLVGRNRKWGDLYSVRFQYGAGRGLRYGLAVQDKAIIRAANHAIAAGLSIQLDSGEFPARLPDIAAKGQQPGPSDKASAAAFFLSDICPAFLIEIPKQKTREHIKLAIKALNTQAPRLLQKDKEAPNRLLINALAYESCGQLADNIEAFAKADEFVDAALSQFKDGIFFEGGGSDTSYQAVALVALHELNTLGYDRDPRVRSALLEGQAWLSSHVQPNGTLDSSQNTRSCRNETFMGRQKDVDLREVFLALAQAEQDTGNSAVIRYKSWLQTRPDPCEGSNP